MASWNYLSFDLLLTAAGDGVYEARVIASPLADQPHLRFRLPFDATTLENLLLKLDPGRTGFRSGPAATTREHAAKEFGGGLFNSIFTGEIADAWHDSWNQALAQGADGLRLRLRLDETPDLVGLPWELLYDAAERSFPALSEGSPVIRFLRTKGNPRSMEVQGPLRVLAIISSPTESSLELEELDVEREWTRIQAAMAAKVEQGLIVLDRLPEATITALGEWLSNHDTHIIHFVGHGDFNPVNAQGFIYFQDERGQPDPKTADELGPFVRDHRPLRLVVVNACRSGRAGSRDPYGGLAQGLVVHGALAVIAMQFPISDKAAVKFAGDFYGALAAGRPVDQAVGIARKFMQARFGSEWATPVLFMRSPDGEIFKHAPTVAANAPRGPDNPAALEVAVAPVMTGPEPPEVGQTAATQADVQQADVEPTEFDLDEYDFLFEPDEPEQSDTTGPDTTGPDTTGPDTTKTGSEGGGWVRTHTRPLVVASIALLVLVAAIVAAVEKPWGEKDRLSETQMLVAAGRDRSHLDVYVVDYADPDFEQRLTQTTTAGEKRWLPVLSPDRRSMIYVRDYPGEDDAGEPIEVRELRTASVFDESEGDALFKPVPDRCVRGADRPAWIPGEEAELVMRCRDADNELSLVRIGVDGTGFHVLLELGEPEASGLTWVGDPTVSDDGRWVAFVGSRMRKEGATTESTIDYGSLYLFDLSNETLRREPLLEEGAHELSKFSDPVFSPGTARLAWRAWVGDPTNGNYEVYVSEFDAEEGTLGEPSNVSNDPDARDQDPMFSDDGQSIVFGKEFRSEGVQHLYRAATDLSSVPKRIDPGEHDWYSVPAWSRR